MPKRITIQIDDETLKRVEQERIKEDRLATPMIVRLVKEALDARAKAQ